MSRPTPLEIAQALGIQPRQVSMLGNRGMPTACLRKAREWFEVHGMQYHAPTHHAARRINTKG